MAFQAYFRRREQEAAAASSAQFNPQTLPLEEPTPPDYVVEITSFKDGASPQAQRPQEYRISYNNDGTLPERVLHMKKASVTTSAVRESPTVMDHVLDNRSSETSERTTDLEKVSGIAAAEAMSLKFGRDLEDKELEAGRGSEESPSPVITDPNIVDWDGPDDPANPQNWSSKRKWGCVAIVATITFLTPLASTMFAPGVPELMADFHNSSTEIAGFVVSVYIIGYVFGPLLIAPLSELYGRRIIFNVTNVLFLIFMIGCALSRNIVEFIIFRFLTGFMGSTPLTVGGGFIADIMPQEKRGAAMAFWACGPILGPIVGPVAGGYAASTIGWRWIFWIISMAAGVCDVVTVFTLRETYAPRILELKTKRLMKETGIQELRSRFDTGQSPQQVFKKAIVRPLKMLILSPIVFLLSLYASICYGYIYLLFTTFTYVFEGDYHFSTGNVGLAFLGIGVGSMIGLVATGIMSDRILKRMSAKGEMKPEYRLPPLIPATICLPIGLFIYGWTAEKHVHWIVPILGTAFFGIGMLGSFMPIATYLIDAWPLYAASSTAANTVLRSLFGAILPLAGQQMYAKLGLGWGNTLLGCVAVAMIPVPFIFLKWGERIRTSPRFRLDL